jgi:hypothetical protein
MRERVRATIEIIAEEELEEALGGLSADDLRGRPRGGSPGAAGLRVCGSCAAKLSTRASRRPATICSPSLPFRPRNGGRWV